MSDNFRRVVVCVRYPVSSCAMQRGVILLLPSAVLVSTCFFKRFCPPKKDNLLINAVLQTYHLGTNVGKSSGSLNYYAMTIMVLNDIYRFKDRETGRCACKVYANYLMSPTHYVFACNMHVNYCNFT